MLEPITVECCQFMLSMSPERMPVHGNLSSSGNEEADREAENAILARLKDGDEWAWCSVVLSGVFLRFYGYTLRGCCSYESESAFLKSDLYRTMQEECVVQINEWMAASCAHMRQYKESK